uniref:Uncharacterized protein n=1 Tax=Globisporangium ultimum (strain ATCC 200006 / CBS 805.95 / DAOM BR144) TaxID=431595 RepID=K3WAK7_GLOUD
MLRRVVLRARRRIPARTAGHDTSELSGPASEHPAALDVYSCSRGDDGSCGGNKSRYVRDLEGFKLQDGLRLLRERAKHHIQTVHQEEQNASDAWTRLQQLYAVFQRVEQEAARELASQPRDEGLRTLLETEICPPGVILKDLEAITEQLPQGFTTEMFVSLGNALYEEMVVSQRNAIDRDAFETVGDHLYAQAISVSA